MAGMRDLYIATPVASNAAVKVATVNGTKTLLQVATPSTRDIAVVRWWVSFDASAAATGLVAELIQTDVAATVTSLTPTPFNDPNAPPSLCVGGTSATGYNASAEGSITATRLLDSQIVPPTSGLIYPWELSGEPNVPISKFLRIRVTAVAVYNCLCGIVFAE